MHTQAPPTISLAALCPCIVAFSVAPSGGHAPSPLAGRVCETLLRCCLIERVAENNGLKTVFHNAAAQVGRACMQLAQSNATATWRLVQSPALFDAATRCLTKSSKLNGAVANFLDAFRHFELEARS
jgi:hypothetical protein